MTTWGAAKRYLQRLEKVPDREGPLPVSSTSSSKRARPPPAPVDKDLADMLLTLDDDARTPADADLQAIYDEIGGAPSDYQRVLTAATAADLPPRSTDGIETLIWYGKHDDGRTFKSLAKALYKRLTSHYSLGEYTVAHALDDVKLFLNKRSVGVKNIVYLGHGTGRPMGFAFHAYPTVADSLRSQYVFMDDLFNTADASDTHTLRMFIGACGSLGADTANAWNDERPKNAMCVQVRLFGLATGLSALTPRGATKIPKTIFLTPRLIFAYLERFFRTETDNQGAVVVNYSHASHLDSEFQLCEIQPLLAASELVLAKRDRKLLDWLSDECNLQPDWMNKGSGNDSQFLERKSAVRSGEASKYVVHAHLNWIDAERGYERGRTHAKSSANSAYAVAFDEVANAHVFNGIQPHIDQANKSKRAAKISQ